jgi:hypothetical protein
VPALTFWCERRGPSPLRLLSDTGKVCSEGCPGCACLIEGELESLSWNGKRHSHPSHSHTRGPVQGEGVSSGLANSIFSVHP